MIFHWSPNWHCWHLSSNLKEIINLQLPSFLIKEVRYAMLEGNTFKWLIGDHNHMRPFLIIFNFLIRSTVHNTLLPMVPWWWSLSLLGSWSVFFKALLLLPFWRDYEIKPIFFPCVHDATLTPNQGQELDAIFFLLKSSTPISSFTFNTNCMLLLLLLL